MELCYSLIEKAYAKLLGSYELLGRLESREHYLRDLTGAPVTKYSMLLLCYLEIIINLVGLLRRRWLKGKLLLLFPLKRLLDWG